MTNLLTVRLCASLLVLVLFVARSLAEGVTPVVKTKTETFANVTLISRSGTHAFVQHSRGLASLKLAELDVATLKSFGIHNAEAVALSLRGESGAAVGRGGAHRLAGISTALSASLGKLFGAIVPGAQTRQMPGSVTFRVLVGFTLAFLFFSYCAKLICEKTGQEPDMSIWLPGFQILPMLRAAGMPMWWLFVMLVPVVNVIGLIPWCLNITRARGKGGLTAISLMLPGPNLFAFLYLAFSRGSGADDETTSPLGKPLETEPLPA